MNPLSYQDDAPVDEADEQLVAYLDGELPPEEVRTLENRLANDATLRHRLRELQNGWEMLDELPLASSSSALLETTLRMVAIDADQLVVPSTKSKTGIFLWAGALAMLSFTCFLMGTGFIYARNYMRYQKQLRDLPIALHLDAFLYANDLELMRALQEMPEWQQATQIAARLGVWDFKLANKVQAINPRQREALLPKLPIEEQEVIGAAWERFESVDEARKNAIYKSADNVAKVPDVDDLLLTMDRFAAWQQSLPAESRDKLFNGSIEDRKNFIREALAETTRQWTRDRGRALTDEETETIYLAVRHLGRLRVDQVRRKSAPEVRTMLDSFGFGNQQLDPQIEATFLRRLFDPKYGGPGRREGDIVPPPFPMPPQGGGSLSAFSIIRNVAENIRGPLRDDELYMLRSVLPTNLADLIDAASGIPNLQEELLRNWAEESLRRTQWNRTGQTVLERYDSRDPEEREAIDLLPADRMLRSLQNEFRR